MGIRPSQEMSSGSYDAIFLRDARNEFHKAIESVNRRTKNGHIVNLGVDLCFSL